MKDKFDFNKVGKRMPYGVPNDFFEHLEAKIMTKIHAEVPMQAEKKHRRTWFIRIVPLSAVAVVAIGFFLLHNSVPKSSTSMDGSYSQVEQAFDALSVDDRNYLLESYHEDLFLNQEL